MKTNSLIIRLVFGCAVCSIWQSCVSTYKPLQLDDLSIDDYWEAISEANVEIAMDDDVLTGPGTKQYAKMQRKSKVSLMVFSIHNAGQQELNLPQDLMFHTSNGDRILPLSLVAAMESLVKPVTDEENTSVIEVEAPDGLGLIWGAGKVANEVKIVVSHVRFAQDMSDYYLENRIVGPGTYMKGLLVLPVEKGTPLDISIKSID